LDSRELETKINEIESSLNQKNKDNKNKKWILTI
jgi:hypothetical protein